MEQPYSITGVVEDVVYQSPDEQYCVLRLDSKEGGRFSLVYHGPAPFIGEEVKAQGQWEDHRRYGRQFVAASLTPRQPTGLQGIENFLASGAIKGIGPALAGRIVAKFGTDTLTVLAQEPGRLAEVRGISLKKAAAMGEAWADLAELRELMLFLESHGISGGYAAKLQAVYGKTAIPRLKDNPYSLATDITGIGFKTADRIAMALGLEKNSRDRIAAGLAYALTTVAADGHVCVPEELLLEKGVQLLQLEPQEVRAVFNELLEQDLLRTEELGGQRLIYPEYLYRAEVGLAKRLLALRDQAKALTRVNAATIINRFEGEAGLSLAPEQRQAVEAALEHGVFILTGGPGTGKTTVIKGIINILEKAGCRILLTAPTGRAAKRLAESSGRGAMTVHRLLDYQPQGGSFSFGKNEQNPLDAEAIIVDEASMLDLTLAYYLVRAVPGGCRLIFVGDADQLASVGAGAVLQDMLRSGQLPVVRLTNVFRQAEVGSIVSNAHRINRGQLPAYTGPQGDFYLKEFAQEEEAAAYVADAYQLLTQDGDWQRVQVLTPMHRNVCGVQNLNRLLQERVNPPSGEKNELNLSNLIFREGDKVMQVKNNYEKDVFNGDIGLIKHIEGKKLYVNFPDRGPEDLVSYEQKELEELQLAYAMSVHKSQGSEYPYVLLLMVNSHYMLLQRNLLYTAVTRAKERVLIVGSRRAVATAVANDRTKRRYSLLAERLQGGQVPGC